MARKSKWTEAQIIGFLKEVEAGAAAKDVSRRNGFSEHTFYRWKVKYGGMEVSEAPGQATARGRESTPQAHRR
jgi:putative transposase